MPSSRNSRLETAPGEGFSDEQDSPPEGENRDEIEKPELHYPTASTRSVHSSTVHEVFQDEQTEDDEKQPPALPKIWGIYDDFQYAPPKPDHNPWSILLEPLMEKDKMQCNVWKEEVQNLLIFAGLFSAVVTAFIIESYKTLKPDPNDAIISLLSIIANRLDNTTTPIPVLISSTGSRSYSSPVTSSIRINNLWFISLVLSLATVRVGTISLQWIREHQSYPNLTPRDSYALFNMRADGLKKWHVPKIFTMLPLVLQSALVLFLTGIIDFLLAFGDVSVIIPVSMVIGLVLLFLIVTTMLPAVQGILICLPYPYTRTSPISPSQCPYKSPQAHAFRVMLSSATQLCRRFYTCQSLWSRWRSEPIDLVICAMITWTKKTWPEFDTAWLKLRHQFMQRYDLNKGRILSDVDDDPPIFDLAQALMANISSHDINIIKNSLLAQYHCFSEVSKWVTGRHTVIDILFHDDSPQAIVQTNDCLRNIMLFNEANGFSSFTNFCNITTHVESRDMVHAFRFSSILHQENLLFFIQSLNLPFKDFDAGLSKHKLELAMRLSTDIHDGEYKHSPTAVVPGFLSILFSVEADQDDDAFLWQWVNNFSTFFLSTVDIQKPCTHGGTLQTLRVTPSLVWDFAFVSLERIFSLNKGLGPAIQGKFIETFQTITDDLNEQMSSPDFRQPNLLFYLTAIYLCFTKYHRQTYHVCLDGLISAMRTYKERTIDAGIIDTDMEEIYGRDTDLWNGPPYQKRFSSKWWDFLDRPGDCSGSSSSRESRPSITVVTAPPP